MPWSRGGEDDAALPQGDRTRAAICLLLAIVIRRSRSPCSSRIAAEALPERVARLMPERASCRASAAAGGAGDAAEQKIADKRDAGSARSRRAGPGKGPAKVPPRVRARACSRSRSSSAGIKVNQQLARLGAEAQVTNAGAASGRSSAR
jgi:hypothetical protein